MTEPKTKVGGEKSPEKSSNRKTFSGLIILPSTLQNDRKLAFSLKAPQRPEQYNPGFSAKFYQISDLLKSPPWLEV